MRIKNPLSGTPILAAAALLLGLLSSCFGGDGGGGGGAFTVNTSAGAFKVESINVANGDVWAINRTFIIRFNHPVNFGTVGFGSIRIRPVSPEVIGNPVTGSFEIVPGSDGKWVLFRPACPTNNTNSNGAFVPGGYTYELSLPTQGSFGATVLRDTSGNELSIGLTRTFRTPVPPTEPLFIDTSPGPPVLTATTFPTGLNLYSVPDPTLEIRFNQAIDGRTTNLNLNNVFLLYSDGEIGSGTENLFCGSTIPGPACTNRVPGKLFLVQNCNQAGARVFFQVTGILPPNRNLVVVVLSAFKDIAGETSTQNQISPMQATPTVTAFYDALGRPFTDPWTESDLAADEYQDSFDTTLGIDPEAALAMPPATVGNGVASASFDYPGTFVSPDSNFALLNNTFLEVDTTGQVTIVDSNSRSFQVVNGVLNVNSMFIQGGSSLRGRGNNPLVIYATGTVTINGTLDVSGNNSHWPTGLNSPQFPEGGAKGECGGGDGGTSSMITNAETPRGQSGFGPFGLVGGGGQGGEGGFNQADNIGSGNNSAKYLMAGGGGGGTFARTPNYSIVWDRWEGVERPVDFDNFGPDHRAGIHPGYRDVKFPVAGPPPARLPAGIQGDPRWPIIGGEPGMRGTGFNSGATPPTAHGLHGMEDTQQDDEVTNDGPPPNEGLWDEPTTWSGAPNTVDHISDFVFGHPTKGPEGGVQGGSIFANDGELGDDFWGRRLNTDGTVTVGELLTPWAGSGGGASGDSQLVNRTDLDGNGTLDEDPSLFFPSVPFPFGGTNNRYRKGAPGGGGGGQLLVFAIGPIRIGTNGRLLSKGGIGHGGESIIFTYNQVSGSGGGSGGHIVLNSAVGVDLSNLNFNPVAGDMTDATAVQNYLDNDRDRHPLGIRAVGGRRGWSASRLTSVGGGRRDGNGNFMVGRGGAGGNGVIQIHVPDPLSSISWPAAHEAGIYDFITNGTYGTPTEALDLGKLEQFMTTVSAPDPYVLIPFFSSGSQFQSKWIDTGMAYLRKETAPAGGPIGKGTVPVYDDTILHFEGTDASGKVLTDIVTERVMQITPLVVTGPTVGASILPSEIRIASASVVFDVAGSPVKAQFLRNPALLIGYDVLPDTSGLLSFEIVRAAYDRDGTVTGTPDTLVLNTLSLDGDMTVASAGSLEWGIRQKFFSLVTGQKDRLPNTASVRVEFQGTDESSPGSNVPDLTGIYPAPTAWTTDLSMLKGVRYFRYRVTYQIGIGGISIDSERPSMRIIKVPFAW